jgi:hypothetical protein
MIIGSIVAGILGPRGYTADPQVEKTMLVIYGCLFLALAFAVVPIFLRVFTTLQTRIGNGDLPPIRWISRNEFTIALCVGVFSSGVNRSPSRCYKGLVFKIT